MTRIETSNWRFAKGGRIFDHNLARTQCADTIEDTAMKYATLVSPTIPATNASNAASHARTACSSVVRMMRAVADGYVEGRRLQAEVLTRRGFPLRCD
jgi:hypothetical protein